MWYVSPIISPDHTTSLTAPQHKPVWRLERPGIEPGAVQIIGPTVDTIETPQPKPIPPFDPCAKGLDVCEHGDL